MERLTSLPRASVGDASDDAVGSGRTENVLERPRLSVVIPHLNEGDNLRRCLRALAAQRPDGVTFEIIVVDNGSVAPPHDICSAFGVRLECEPEPGPGPARNRGAAVAAADLVAFIDADCVAQDGWVRSLVERMDAEPEIGVIGGDIGVLLADPKRPTAVELYECIFAYRARLYVERYGFAATGNMAVRASVFRTVGPFGGIHSMEDTEWGVRASALGVRIAFLPAAKVLTPSCASFAELKIRWDRHVAHQYARVGHGPLAVLRWLANGAVVAVSPAVEAIRVLRSDQVAGLPCRLRAFGCLSRIRLHRARRMVELALGGDPRALVESWNRTTT